MITTINIEGVCLGHKFVQSLKIFYNGMWKHIKREQTSGLPYNSDSHIRVLFHPKRKRPFLALS